MTKGVLDLTSEIAAGQYHVEMCGEECAADIQRIYAAHRAEVERLRGTCEWQLENDRKAAESIARLLAENKRLRATLRQILEGPEYEDPR